MSLLQALAYFSREALLGLVRSWKVSLLAILTIAVSLFLAGVFLLVSVNLRQVMSAWRAESKVVVYLEAGTAAAARQAVAARLRELSWVETVEEVSSEQAASRFAEHFPSLADLLEGWEEEPLPVSFELGVDWATTAPATIDGDLAELAAEPAVAMVDDDREWLGQVQTVVLVLEGLGLILGAILLGTAIFTIGSVIRLTAYLYHEEIAVMRQVGATEFFIRGPFYVEGLFQGLAGGLVAVVTLAVGHAVIQHRHQDSTLVSLLAADFLAPAHLAALVALGGAAGLFGAVASLRRESLGQTAEMGRWAA